MTNNNLPKVALRGGFSDRMGIDPINKEVQTKDFDRRTRVSMVNLLDEVFEHVYENDLHSLYPGRNDILIGVLSDVYLRQVSHSMYYRYNEKEIFEKYINKTILNDEYASVLTVLEYLIQEMDKYSKKNCIDINTYDIFNKLFEKEYVGYRFINGIIAPITRDEEVQEITDAMKCPFQTVNKHLDKALYLLSNRETPDYENSIKESISAVEALCFDISGTHITLSDALKKLEKEKVVSIHPALKEAFIKLYGYTNDADAGIRHAAKIGDSGSTFQEARYMLVACSAFINYLKANLSEQNRK